ncbi:hypothetical protein [Amycolatopsis tolypomycina]|uniref:hypothetical protein n=1 Tax=Amycolatopsis tolypomycina TaxID=208445 RepID=UPI00142E62A5|nr:hypothetical protein [Amycolatopsis tolypomycina]
MTARPADLTTWHYTCGHHEGTVVTGAPDDRASLADAVITPARSREADGRAALAGLFDRLPGLTLAAVPIRSTGLLLGDRLGHLTLTGHGPAEPAAVVACAWLTTGRPLTTLAAITGWACRPGSARWRPETTSPPWMIWWECSTVEVAERRTSAGDRTSARGRNSWFWWRCTPPRGSVP